MFNSNYPNYFCQPVQWNGGSPYGGCGRGCGDGFTLIFFLLFILKFFNNGENGDGNNGDGNNSSNLILIIFIFLIIFGSSGCRGGFSY